LIVFLGLGLAAGPSWADVSEAEAAALRSVIEDQMAAFRADDGPRAFAHATESLQTQFGTADQFMSMVRQGYAAVYRPRDVRFDGVQEAHGQIVQRVLVVGPDGVAQLAIYIMERQGDGSWRIAGCPLLALPGQQV